MRLTLLNPPHGWVYFSVRVKPSRRYFSAAASRSRTNRMAWSTLVTRRIRWLLAIGSQQRDSESDLPLRQCVRGAVPAGELPQRRGRVKRRESRTSGPEPDATCAAADWSGKPRCERESLTNLELSHNQLMITSVSDCNERLGLTSL